MTIDDAVRKGEFIQILLAGVSLYTHKAAIAMHFDVTISPPSPPRVFLAYL